MSKPRRIYLLKTEHFDFLFSEPSAGTAKLLADNGERLYGIAREALAGRDLPGGDLPGGELGDEFGRENIRGEGAVGEGATEGEVAVGEDVAEGVLAVSEDDRGDGTVEAGEEKEDFIHDLRIPVIISPDSDRLSVDYTCSPYNRIVIFDGVPEADDNEFQNTLLGLFYHEVYLALSQSVRDPINQFIYRTVGGDGYQPISLVYLPFSFVEGRAFLEEGRGKLAEGEVTPAEGEMGTDEGAVGTGEGTPSFPFGRFTDKEFLEILSVAKYEEKFPNWIQAGTDRDIYPGRILNEAAGSAFSAYLMHTYGIDKYIQFWNQCGKINFHLTSGMFKKVYGLYLSDLWKDFEDSIPLPQNLEKIKELEKETKTLFKGDSEGVASNLIISDYGLVWYDDIRHEVDILDLNSSLLMKRLLFLASDVKKLALSPDGRYLIVSFYGVKSRQEFRNDKVWIYDLQDRKFLDYDFKLRDGVFVKTAAGENVESESKTCVAGIYVKDKISSIHVYNFDEENKKDIVYEKKFNTNEYPCNLTYAGNGKISYITSKNNKETLRQYNFNTKEEKGWNILYKGQQVNIKNLRPLAAEKGELKLYKDKNFYTFEYFPQNETSFTRMGIIILDKDFNPCEVLFQDLDVAGGVKYPAILNNHILFCSNKFTHNEIQYLPAKEIPFIKGTIEEISIECINGTESQVNNEKYTIENKKLGNYELKGYNPLKYMAHMSFIPFMSLKDLADTKDQKLWPSLGGTFITQYDPFMNSRIMLSGSAGYAKLDFSTIINPTVDDVNEQQKKDVDDNKNINFGISIENTSTPVDIRAGCLFKFNKNGEYNFAVKANTFFQIPFGMAFSKFNFGIHGSYTAATDYYDRNLAHHFPSLNNWPSFREAYETSKLSFTAEYSNIHQYGLSKYEERGFSLGVHFDSFWDITEIKFLNDKIDKLEEELKKGDKSELTKAQINKLHKDEMLQLSQLILGVYGEVKIPRLIPFNTINGFVVSMPGTIKAEVFNEPGTAVRANGEILLLGYECQNGFPFLYLYFSRLGLKFGYNIDLNYDTLKVPLPDLRVKDNLWDIFSNTYVRDSLYFIYNMDFSTAIGRLSDYHLNLSMKTEYFIRSKGFAFSLNFLVSF